MLTMFSTIKPCRGHFATIQRNAIKSWTLLKPECEIILFGDEDGTAEIASQFGLRHIVDVGRNEYGTPLVSSMFSLAQSIASNKLVCFITADVILLSDFLPAISRIKRQRFVCIGQRWDINIAVPLDFSAPDWETNLRLEVAQRGKLHPPTGMDYFVFPCGFYDDVPALAFGRLRVDQWLAYRARSRHVPLIDATRVITVVHQNHDYSHMPGGYQVYQQGPESTRNLELAGPHFLRLRDATWILTPRGLRPALSREHIYFRWNSIPVLYPRLRFLVAMVRTALRPARFVRRKVLNRVWRGREDA